MLRKLLDYQLSLTEKGKPLAKLRPLISALDTFLYEAPHVTPGAPHIRDTVDLKRWMSLVVLALIPTILMAIWNSGLQSMVFSSGDYHLMDEYLASLGSFHDYFAFVAKNNRYLNVITEGLSIFLPIMLVSYIVGGLWEALFAIVRKHDIAEGFLVTGMLYPLILPPTTPLWIVAVGVSVGVILSKEVFGGTGMNIMNPALACRCFVFFAYPGRMSGDVWVGMRSHHVQESLLKMNQDAGKSGIDAYTQATPLAKFNVAPEIKTVHVDALATNNLGRDVPTIGTIDHHFETWNHAHGNQATLGQLSPEQMKGFITGPLTEGGLGLSPGLYEDAANLSGLRHGIGPMDGDWTLFFGNKLGCLGETSAFACLLGAFILILTGVASWRSMVAVALGAFLTASCYEWAAWLFTDDRGAWLAAQYSFPAYKHLIIGGVAFGLVYMVTDPVSSCNTRLGQWIYGFLIGLVLITIRVINPAFPEGMMLAVILANCFHPLIDHYVVLYERRRALRRAKV